MRAHDDVAVDAVALGEGGHGRELVFQPRLDAQRRQVGPAVVQPVGRCRVAGGGAHGIGVFPGGHARIHRIEVHRARALDDLGQRRHADPRARVARQLVAVQAELQVLGHARGLHHGHAPGHEGVVALVRHRRRHAAVVVARHHQHAAVRRRAIRIAVLERVARAVHARALAVPHGVHAIDGALGVGFDTLRAQHLRGGQLLVHGGHEADARLLEALTGLPDGLVDHAQRRAAVAAHEALRVQAACRVALALHRQDADQRLRAGEEDRAGIGPEVVGKLVVGPSECGRFKWGVHARNCSAPPQVSVSSIHWRRPLFEEEFTRKSR
ncbi:hypothetical protein FQZ97_604120 [compost metagenome]